MLTINTLVFIGMIASHGWQAQTQQIAVTGQVHGLYAADYNADAWPDLLVVSSRNSQRFIDIYDGQQIAKNNIAQPHRIAVPRDVSFFDLCPTMGPGVLWIRSGRIERLAPDAVLHKIANLPATSYAFVEQGDLERISICQDQRRTKKRASKTFSTTRPLLMIPGLGQSQVLRSDGQLLHLQAPQQVYMINGQRYRGPRARRDLSLMTMLISPRQYAGHILSTDSWDLAMTLEDRLLVYSADALANAEAPTLLAPSFAISIGPRSQSQRRSHKGLVDVQLFDFSGDGIDDALVSFQQGQSSDMRSRWQLIAGPLDQASADSLIADEKYSGLASPLVPVDLNGDGVFAVLEPRIDTGVMTMGKALMTGLVTVHYRLHYFLHKKHQRSARWSLKQSLNLTGSRSFSGRPPLLNADFDGDGFRDFVDLGQDKKLRIFAGQNGLKAFAAEASLEQNIPSTSWVVSLRRGKTGASTLVVLDQTSKTARLQFIHVRATTPR